ncbi:hypothetical protein [Dongia sp.]|uniref:hypothetical protein n=1 Tax=Dongia sp. TaxID=1977262 RepID=UPI003753CE29
MTAIVENVPDGDAGLRRKRARDILARPLLSACGQSVTVSQQAKAILEPCLDLVLVLGEAVGKVRLRRGWVEFEVDLGRRVGWERHVRTNHVGLDDETWFVLRCGHAGASRVEVEELPVLQPTSKVTLVIDGGWPKKDAIPRLETAWIGGLRPPEPWEPRLSGKQAIRALAFWSQHAFEDQPDAQEGKPFRSTFREVIKEAKVMSAYHEIRCGRPDWRHSSSRTQSFGR